MTDNDEMTETRHERLAREAEKHRVHEALAEEVARLRAQKAELVEALKEIVDAEWQVSPDWSGSDQRNWTIEKARAAIRRAEEGLAHE